VAELAGRPLIEFRFLATEAKVIEIDVSLWKDGKWPYDITSPEGTHMVRAVIEKPRVGLDRSGDKTIDTPSTCIQNHSQSIETLAHSGTFPDRDETRRAISHFLTPSAQGE
jgi:hypothetical protein